jgi:transposase InsO family protein
MPGVQNGSGRCATSPAAVRREFSATAANQLWSTDITEHPTGEGKLYLCDQVRVVEADRRLLDVGPDDRPSRRHRTRLGSRPSR